MRNRLRFSVWFVIRLKQRMSMISMPPYLRGKMKYKVLAGILVAILLNACRQNKEQPMLADEKIARIMADLYVAEAATTGLSGYPKDSLTHVYYEQALKMHGITKEQYEKDLRILTRDVPRMEAIMEQVQLLLEPEKKDAKKSATE